MNQVTIEKAVEVEIMTLAEILPAIQQLSAIEKLKLIRILAEDISPLEPFKTYDLLTSYNNFGVGEVSMDALKQSNVDY